MIPLSQKGVVDFEYLEISERWWDNKIIKFQKAILRRKYEDDDTLFKMEMLLAMKNEKGWTLFSKGPQVLVVDYDPLIYDSLEEFEN